MTMGTEAKKFDFDSPEVRVHPLGEAARDETTREFSILKLGKVVDQARQAVRQKQSSGELVLDPIEEVVVKTDEMIVDLYEGKQPGWGEWAKIAASIIATEVSVQEQ